MLRIALLFAFAAGLAWAQAGSSFEIRVAAIEVQPDGRNPVPLEGVEINLIESVSTGGSANRKPIATVYTGRSGEFVFHPDHPGIYSIDAKKKWYTSPEYGITLDQTHPSALQHLLLIHAGNVSGRVVDGDGRPVAGQQIAVGQIVGRLTGATGPDGRFTVTGVIPGSYSVAVAAPATAPFAIGETQFSAKDLDVVDQDVETRYWPGGTELPEAAIVVNPGADTSVGDMRIRTRPGYRMHISLRDSECAADEKVVLGVLRQEDFSALRGDGSGPQVTPETGFFVPCGGDFLRKHLRPGHYRLSVNREGQASEWAEASVEISNKNVEVTLNLRSEMEIRGRIVAAEGASLPAFTGMRVHTSGQEVVPNKYATPDADGKFVLANLKFPRHNFDVGVLGKEYYVKEIRLNGVPVAGWTLMLSEPVNQLEIVIGDQPGAITGTVMDGGVPAVGVYVQTLYPEGNAGTRRGGGGALTDAQGKFQITGLAPGEYRLMAVPLGRRVDNAYAEAFTRLAAGAPTVRVERGGTVDVALPLSHP